MLDLVGCCRLREKEMLLPAPCRIGEVGMRFRPYDPASGTHGGVDDPRVVLFLE
jgi:hypothetical protein